MNVRDLMEKRARLVNEARGVVEAAEKENRNLTTEEQTRYDKLMADVLDHKDRIDRATALAEVEARTNSAFEGGELRNRPEQGGEQRSQNPRETPEYRKAFESWMRGGLSGLNGAESRALQADVQTSGGFLVTPMQFVNDLIQAVDNLVWIRQWATVIPVPSAASLGVPSLDTDVSDPAWTTEVGTGTEDSSMAFGRRELYPHPLAKRIKLSNKLLRQVPGVEALVRSRLAYKFAVTMENAYLNGNGQNAPLGVFTANADGISTSRDVSTDNTTTAMTVEGLMNAKYALKPQYWANAKWLFHRDGIKQIAKIRDLSGGAGTGQFLWQPSITEGVPDRLLNMPVFASEYVPNTFTTGLYVGILGDWSQYWIADALDMQVQRLVELYAETNQVGLIGRMESDGMPVLAEAFVRVKLA